MGLFDSISGSIAGSVINSALSYVTDSAKSKQQHQYNKRQQNDAQAHDIYMAQNAHQMEIEDLKNAGLNPVLSAGGSSVGHSGVSASSPTSGYSTSPVNSAMDFLRFKNESKNIDANTKTQEATQQKLGAETNQINLQNKFIEPEKKAEIKRMNQETALNSAQTALKNSEQEKIYSDMRLNNAKMAESRSNTEYNKRRASGKGIGAGGSIGTNGVQGNININW